MLYRVKVTYETVVTADDPEEAVKIADKSLKKEDLSPTENHVQLLTNRFEIPTGWVMNDVPYGPDQETTIAGHLKKK